MLKEANKLKIIIKVAGEGGSISLLRREDTGTCEYTIAINEKVLLDYLNEEPNETEKIEKEYNWVNNWKDVFDRFCDFPIKYLSPIHVDPEYAVRIWIKLKDLNDGRIPRRWLIKLKEVCPDIVTLANWINNSCHTVVLTGAGMSTESGIPDFRSKTGIWKNVDPMKVATQNTLINNYDSFHEFYLPRLNSLKDSKPHKGYEILAKWESIRLVDSIITQNVDDFHLIVGSKKVIRLHGSLNECKCSKCNYKNDKELFIKKVPCEKCGGNLRPGVVLFGENLPELDLLNAKIEMKKAELVIIIGTSLVVYPVNQLPNLTNGKVVYINMDYEGNQHFDLVLVEKAGEILRVLDDIISN